MSAYTRAEVISPLRLLQRLFDKFFVEVQVLAMTPCVGREARPYDEVKATKTMIERTERRLEARTPPGGHRLRNRQVPLMARWYRHHPAYPGMGEG